MTVYHYNNETNLLQKNVMQTHDFLYLIAINVIKFSEKISIKNVNLNISPHSLIK